MNIRINLFIVALIVLNSAALYSVDYEKQLLEAVSTKNIVSMNDALNHNADVNTTNDADQTPLLIAVEQNNDKIVTMLIDAGANLNQKDANGAAPLYLAIEKGHENIAKLLINHGADVNQSKNKNTSPLLMAIINTKNFPRNDQSHIDLVKALIQKCANVNEAYGPEGVTPLLASAQYGNVYIATMLVESGANVNTANQQGITPLYQAAASGLPLSAKLFMSKGANVAPALQLAQKYNNDQARKIILAYNHHPRKGAHRQHHVNKRMKHMKFKAPTECGLPGAKTHQKKYLGKKKRHR